MQLSLNWSYKKKTPTQQKQKLKNNQQKNLQI